MNISANNIYKKSFSQLVVKKDYQDLEKYQAYWDDWLISKHENLMTQLRNANSEAWEFIRLYAIRFYVFRTKTLLLQQVKDLHWGPNEEDELYCRLYHRMIVDNKIDVYHHQCPIQFWMRLYVREIIITALKKQRAEKKYDLSQNGLNSPYQDKDVVIVNEQCEQAQRCFAELWRDNPIQAYVLLLREKINLSSKKVAALLDQTNDVNVNQIHTRAVQNLKNISQRLFGQE